MTLALTFVTPLLLLGLLASFIPLVLHLLSSVRAQETYFPTLRFLRMSMEKTARRRRIQHWLLLLLRTVLLALLAMGVAEPVSEAVGGWLTGRRYATAIILDNSMSMAARSGATTRFDRAKAEATALLAGDHKPSLAAVLTTNEGLVSKNLTGELNSLREGVAGAGVGAGRAPIARRLEQAIEMLRDDSTPQRSVYLFSDLQRVSFEEVSRMKQLADASDIHLLIVNTAEPKVRNVGVSSLDVAGQQVVDEILEITATLTNSSPTDSTVNVGLWVDGRETGQRLRKTLRAAGREGSSATVRFHHRFGEVGAVTGQVRVDLDDDLARDNVRRFSLTVGGRIRALVVRGEAPTTDPAALDPVMMLRVALDPYGAGDAPWSILPTVIEADEFAEASLANADVAFFCNVPSFTAAQAGAVARFVRGGGTAVLFLGPDVQAANYNERFLQAIPAEGGLLPGRLVEAVGQVGPDADAAAVDWVDLAHPYLKGLYENHADYLSVLVQRYYRLAASARPGKVLMRLDNGDPLLQVKRFGAGRVVLCATTASPRWSNLPVTGLFLPMAARMSLLAPENLGSNDTYLAGAQVTIRPGRGRGAAGGAQTLPKGAAIQVTAPGHDAEGKVRVKSLPVRKTREGNLAVFTDTSVPGVYRWKLLLPGVGPDDKLPAGAFAVNPPGVESRLEAYSPEQFKDSLQKLGCRRVYVAGTVEQVNRAAADDARGRNWWDLMLAAAILLLVVEAVVANRFRKQEEPAILAHLNPRVA